MKWGEHVGRSYNLLQLPCSLEDALMHLTLNELLTIRRSASFSCSGGLRKAALAREMAAQMPDQAPSFFDLFEEYRATLMRHMLAHRGVVPLAQLELTHTDVRALTRHGIFVEGEHEGVHCVGVPLELLEMFKQHDGLRYAARVAENTRWIAALQGAVYYYGVISTHQAYDLLSLLFGKEDFFRQKPCFWDVCPAMQDFRGAYLMIGDYFCDSSLSDPSLILRRRPANVGYRLFNLPELFAAVDPLHVDPTPEGELLYEYLLEHYSLPELKAKRLIHVGRRIALWEGKVAAAFAAYAVICGASVHERDPELGELVLDYIEHTPHWALCGHTIADLQPNPPETDGVLGKLVDFSEYKNRGKQQ